MLRFYIIRASKELFGHIILIFLPVLLISFFYNVISSNTTINTDELSIVLTIGFVLTFQIYGSAISFETLGHDFLTPIHDRLLAAPVNPRKIVSSILFTGIFVSFMQSIVIIIFSVIILDTNFDNLVSVLLILLVSVIFNQLLGTVVLFLTQKVRTATAITSLYGIVAPIITGLYFPLPDNKIFELLERYLTPMSLARTAIFGILYQNVKDVLAGLVPLVILIIIMFMLIKPLSRKVIV